MNTRVVSIKELCWDLTFVVTAGCVHGICLARHRKLVQLLCLLLSGCHLYVLYKYFTFIFYNFFLRTLSQFWKRGLKINWDKSVPAMIPPPPICLRSVWPCRTRVKNGGSTRQIQYLRYYYCILNDPQFHQGGKKVGASVTGDPLRHPFSPCYNIVS